MDLQLIIITLDLKVKGIIARSESTTQDKTIEAFFRSNL